MAALQRVQTGSFTLEDAYSIEDLEKFTFEDRLKLPLPVESLFSEYREINLPTFFANLYLAGVTLLQKKLRVTVADGELVRIKYGELFLGLGRGSVGEDGEAMLKVEKLFHLERIN